MKLYVLMLCYASGLYVLPSRPCLAADTQTRDVPLLVAQNGHSEGVLSVAFSPDGKMLASGSIDHTAKLWDVASGQLLRTLSGHSSWITTIAYSPDGKTLASGSGDHTVKLWDVSSGQELRTLRGHADRVNAIAFSPDGKTLASGSDDHTVRLWDVSSGQELRTPSVHPGPVVTVAYSPDGKTLASGGNDDTVRMWEVDSGQQVHTLSAHSGNVTKVAFSPDGKLLASGSDTLELWDVESGQALRTLHAGPYGVATLAFSPDGKTLAVDGADNNVTLWEIASGRELRTLSVHLDGAFTVGVFTLAFSPDGKTLASGSLDSAIKLWEVASGLELRTLSGHTNRVNALAFSPNGATLAACAMHDDNITLWDVANGQTLRTLTGHSSWVTTIAYAPDGRMLASGSLDDTIKLWDVASDKVPRTLTTNSGITTIAFSPDGKTLASGVSNTITLWEVATGKELRTLTGHVYAVTTIAFSPDGTILASGSEDKTVRLWEVASGQELRTLQGDSVGGVATVAFSPDGKTLASGGWDQTVRLWDASGQSVRTLKGHTGPISSVAFSPDGTALASASDDNTVQLWDVASGRELRTLSGHSSGVTTVTFSPDGNNVASGSDDQTIKLWGVADNRLLATLIGFSDVRWVVTDPEGRFDTADLEDMPYLHWVMADDPFTPLPLEIFMHDYYEPRLLSRIMNRERFKMVRPLGTLNRVQPEVKITSVQRVPKQPEWVDVSVAASGMSRTYETGKLPVKTGVHDLRLLRDGQLVGYSDGKLTEFGKAPYRKTFRVRMPTGAAALRFTSYAFNDDRVKSNTAAFEFRPPALARGEKARAYVIAVGVNHHDNEAWNLQYAANDARAVSESVVERIRAQDRYQDVVPVTLISDDRTRLATKANLTAVLERLAGHIANVGAVPNADRLHPATPDDLVLVSFSGHGVDFDGEFYLVPGDTGPGQSRTVAPELLAHAISSDELASWFRDVDAGYLALIIDACQSAASVGSEFKPGPMGARGLGQLAYEKGMLILAASQAEQSAQESRLTQEGLLTYALVDDGLERGLADYNPRDAKITLAEWLSYGVKRVPGLAVDVAKGKLQYSGNNGTKRGVTILTAGYGRNPTLQQPALFDFTKGKRDTTLATHVASSQ